MSKSQTFDRLRLIDRIDRSAVSAGAAALLGYIQRVQQGRRWHFVTGDALAAILKVSRRSVVRYLAELDRVGLLAIWRRKALRDGKRVNIASGYRVVLDAVQAAAVDGAAVRKLALMGRVRDCLGRAAQRLRKPVVAAERSCANLAHHARSKDLRGMEIGRLWGLLGHTASGSADRLAICRALDDAQAGEYPGQVVGEWS